MDIGAIWDLIILNPMINILVVLTKVLFSNVGLAIILLTIVIRGIMFPLQRRQMQSTRKMQELQPKLQELQKKYARDSQRLAQEQMALYKTAGVSPMGCLGPMVIQMPIWITLYQSIIRVLATSPEAMLNLSRHLYVSWPVVFDMVPLNSSFLWLDLGQADATMILPILVGVTMWVQQKMTTPMQADPKAQSQSQMMLYVMPAMFAMISMNVPSGLALYWFASNLIGVIMQYFVSGWGPLADTLKFLTRKGSNSGNGKQIIEKKPSSKK